MLFEALPGRSNLLQLLLGIVGFAFQITNERVSLSVISACGRAPVLPAGD